MSSQSILSFAPGTPATRLNEWLQFFDTTGSDRPLRMLKNWNEHRPKFVKVYPSDYRRVIEAQKKFRAQGLPDDEAVMAAFEANSHDLARAGGK